jgi:hypothetical protein
MAQKNTALPIRLPQSPREHFAVDAVGLAHALERRRLSGVPPLPVVFAVGRNGALLQAIGLAQVLGRDRIMYAKHLKLLTAGHFALARRFSRKDHMSAFP